MGLADFLDAPAAEVSVPVEHLSASSISMFMRCPEQFRRRYVLGQKERPGAALVIGSGFHFANETNFGQKIASGVDLPETDIREAFHAGFDQAIEKNGGHGEIEWDSRESADTLRQKGENLAVQYRVAVAPHIQPAAVEQKFETLLEGVPVPILGYVDLETTVAQSSGGPPEDDPFLYQDPDSIVDYKTAKAARNEMKPEWLLQARLYQLMKRKRVAYHIAVKTKEPKIVTPLTAPELALEVKEQALSNTQTLIQRVSRQIAWHYAEFGPDQAWPGAITHPWACGFCGYRDNCMWWAS